MKEDRLKTVKLLRFDVMNLNNRVYTKEEVMPHIEKLKGKINKYGVVYGELGFPENFDVSLSRASHAIKDLYIEGDFLMGKIQIIKTKYGDELLKNFDSMVFRSRGTGFKDMDSNIVRLRKIFTFDAILEDTDAFKGLMD